MLEALRRARSLSAPSHPVELRASCSGVEQLDIYRSFNALAETINGLFKTEVIWKRGPWRTAEDVEFATLEWVDWFNNRRLLGPLGFVPPVEFEADYYRRQDVQARAA